MTHQLPPTCVMDACFIIDWARWSGRDLIWKAFSTGFVPEIVLREIVSPSSLGLLRRWIVEGWLTIYPHSSELESEAVRLMLELRRDPRIPRIDAPEAVCVVIARRIGAVALTENRGILRAYQLTPERLKPAVVWNSLRLLAYLYSKGFLDAESFYQLVEEYEEEVKHRFSKREVRRVALEFGV